MLLNMVIVTGFFVVAAFIDRQPPPWMKQAGFQGATLDSTLWLAAMLLSLPLLIATIRKLQALAIMVADQTVPRDITGEGREATRLFVERAVVTMGMVVIGLYVLLLGATLLPPMKVLVPLLIVVALITWLLWRSFIKLYSTAQVALQETLDQPPPSDHTEEFRTQIIRPSTLLHDAKLEDGRYRGGRRFGPQNDPGTATSHAHRRQHRGH